jgi:hypothetical protein
LLGDASQPGTGFIPEATHFGFDNSASGAVLSPVVVEQYESAAQALVARAKANLPALLNCDVVTQGEDACANQFIDSFFKRAYRRPLEASERQRLVDFYQVSKSSADFETAISMLVSVGVQSPKFLYRLEFGMPSPTQAGSVELSSWELASRISYLLIGSMPDTELLSAAEQGLLSTPQQLLGQAQRLLDSERGARVVQNFYRQWTHLDKVGELKRSAASFTDAIPGLLQRETETFVDQVIRKGDGQLATLLTAPFSFMNQELASYYGVDQPPMGDKFVRVELDPARYSGLLTHAGLMAQFAHDEQPSAVARGVFVREQLLCTELPSPPANVDATLPEPDPGATAREQLTQKTSAGPCNGCHAAINPLGFAFEHFDQLGRHRTTDGDLAINSSGELTGTDVDGPFVDHIGLAQQLSKSEMVRSCVVTNWFRYAHGREEAPSDNCTTQQLTQAFSQSGGNIKQLILSITQTRAFKYRGATMQGAQL